MISNLDILSVREFAGATIVDELVGVYPPVLIDPVFLLERSQWHKLAKNPDIQGKYILTYSINKSECYYVAKKIQEETGLQIIGLQTPMSNRIKCRAIRDESPEEFLGWIENAQYVVTDSFHGTAFSIIFNKCFVCCSGGEGENRLSRQKTLLNSVNLLDRFCNLKTYKKIYEKINYIEVQEYISVLQEKAFRFLKNAIE